MENIIHLLHKGGYSCVIDNNEIRTFTQRGIADLYNLLTRDAAFLQGASIADKGIGKAAAALLTLGGIKEVYTDVISLPALNLLRNADVEVTFKQMVPFIQNRDQTDWCPMEKRCHQKEAAEDILPLIKDFIEKR